MKSLVVDFRVAVLEFALSFFCYSFVYSASL